jgi:septal ring factor EnvC (AmiA/AmiB activator)
MRFLKILLLFILVFSAISVHAQQPGSSELKKRRDKLNEELQQLNQEYQETLNNKKTSLKQLSLLKAQINLREEKINNINSEIRNLDNQISESTNTVHSLQSQLTQLKKQYEAMILFAYRNKSGYNKLMFVFAAQDFNQAYKRLKYLQQIGDYRQRQAEYIQGTEKDLHVKINELDATKKAKDDLLQDQEKEKKTLGDEKNSQVQVVVSLSKQEGDLKQQQKDVQRKIAATQREINAAIQREIAELRKEEEEKQKAAAKLAAAKAKADNTAVIAPRTKAITSKSSDSEVLNATPEAAKLSNDFLGNRGSLPWPVTNGFITQGFGRYRSPEGIENESTGVDIKSNPGANVRAVFQGTVITVRDVIGTYLVIIRHGEYLTAYSNLKTVSVAKGDKVGTKQVIGTVATDPSSGITNVHLDLMKGTTFLDPKGWLTPN